MRPLTRALLCLLFCLSVVQPLAAVDQIILFPSGNATQLPVLRAADLSIAGSIAAPSSSFAVIQSLDGQKYYILTRRATPSILVADANTLEVLTSIELGASVTDAAVSPDGRYLLAATGDLRIIDTATDQVATVLDVGGAPTKILFDDAATRRLRSREFRPHSRPRRHGYPGHHQHPAPAQRPRHRFDGQQLPLGGGL